MALLDNLGIIAGGLLKTYIDNQKKNTETTTTQTTGGAGDGTEPSTGAGGGYMKQYISGTNPELDAKLKKYTDAYTASRNAGDAQGMQEANDSANQVRNQYGYAAEFANQDIANVSAQNASTTGAGTGGSGGGSGGDVEDYTGYLEELYASQRDSNLKQLQAAYQQNVAALDQAAEKIPGAYRAARNRTAGASELAKRNFAEYASSTGLNSGAEGQGELARNVTLQNNLNSINTQEASSLSDLELQRTELENQYNSAIAQAKTDNNFQLAQALYQEKVRVNDAILNQMNQQAALNLQQSQFDWQVGQQAWQNQLTQQQYADSQGQQRYNNVLSLTQVLGANALMPSQALVLIEEAQKKGAISEEQAKTLLKQYGFQA